MMQENSSYHLFKELIEDKLFVDKYSELLYMVRIMEAARRFTGLQSEELLRLGREMEEGTPSPASSLQ